MHIATYSKKLCMTEFRISYVRYDQDNVVDISTGERHASFLFLEKGTLCLRSMNKTITVSEGAVCYIPAGLQYYAIWKGQPEIIHYSIDIISKKYDLPDSEYFPVQVLHDLPTEQMRDVFSRIYTHFAAEDRIQQIYALGMYYQFYAQALTLLQAEEPIRHSAAVVAAIQYIEENYTKNYSVEQLAEVCHISASTLYHLFQKEIHISPHQYRTERRVERAAVALRQTQQSISEIALQCGFCSPAYFLEVFKKHTGMTPSAYRRTVV